MLETVFIYLYNFKNRLLKQKHLNYTIKCCNNTIFMKYNTGEMPFEHNLWDNKVLPMH